jgi:hypothetical protein
MRTSNANYPALSAILVFIPCMALALSCCTKKDPPIVVGETGRAAYAKTAGFSSALCDAVLDKYIEDGNFHPTDGTVDGPHGLACVEAETGGLELLVLSTEKGTENLQPYKYVNGAQTLDLTVRRVFAPVPDPDAETGAQEVTLLRTFPCGTTATGSGMGNKFGTAGLNILFNNQLAVLGSAHCLCKNLSPGQIGTPVFVAGQPVAKLACFQPVYPIPPNNTPASHRLIGNYCDLAIATYTAPGAIAQMSPCATSTFAYPTGLATGLNTQTPCHKVGAGGCGGTVYIGQATETFPLAGHQVSMVHQCFFRPNVMKNTDSGCVMIRNADNKVIGLHMASLGMFSFANPIYGVPWTWTAPSFPGDFVHVTATADPSFSYSVFNANLFTP